MEFTSVPIIVIFCYIIGEIYKEVFKNKKDLYKLIPLITTVIGGILGAIIYKTSPQIIFNTTNIYNAILIGIISGSSATGTNQIIKQFIKGEKNNE